jgi:hypothetical protein
MFAWPKTGDARLERVGGSMSPAVAPRNQVQGRPAHFFNGCPRYANVGEQTVIKFKKFTVLASSFPPLCYSGQP